MRLVMSRRAAVETALLILFLPLLVIGLRWGVREFSRAAYPTRYSELVEAAAAEYDLPPALLYAVIRTESGFRTDAVSSAQARGLMQITEDTFLWAQSRSPQTETLTAEKLHDPAINIRYGAYILSLLREQFSETDTVLAAYNAGAGNVGRWLKDPAYSADGRTLSVIPIRETSDYVRKVSEARERYERLYDWPDTTKS